MCVCVCVCVCVCLCDTVAICTVSRVFTNGPEELCSISGRGIPKT